MMTITGSVKEFKEGLLDFVFPKVCLICNTKIDLNSELSFICQKCYYNLPAAPSSNEIIDRMFNTFESDDIAISEAFGLFSLKNNEFLNPIHSLKYEGLNKIGYEFGKELGKKIKSKTNVKYDAVIPVPIHSAKKRERGYNQSRFISQGISESLDINFREDIIFRAKYTKSQTTLNSEQRKINITNVFKTTNDSTLIKNKTFLIVDDVFTTGSTINFLAMELLESGAQKIDCATLGIA